MKPLLVGMAPGHGDPSKPLEGRVGKRLAELAHLTVEEYLARTARVNLVEHDVPRGKWPVIEALKRAHDLELTFLRGQTVILLGRRVAEAFSIGHLDYFEWTHRWGTLLVPMPHPSGLNRWWNDPKHVVCASMVLAQLLR